VTGFPLFFRGLGAARMVCDPLSGKPVKFVQLRLGVMLRGVRQGRCYAPEANRAALAGGSLILKAIEAYLALRRATGFAMLNAEYLLNSFAAFATERGQTHVHTHKPQLIGRCADRLSRNAMPG
jgi:hypothetical protein